MKRIPKLHPLILPASLVELARVGLKTEFRRPVVAANTTPDGRSKVERGDLFWVREPYWTELEDGVYSVRYGGEKGPILDPTAIRIFGEGELSAKDLARWTEEKYRPGVVRAALSMPRVFSRLWLEVAKVRRERLWAVDAVGARAEGVSSKKGWLRVFCDRAGGWSPPFLSPIRAFAELWNYDHGPESRFAWSDNPEVWVYSFRVYEQRRTA